MAATPIGSGFLQDRVLPPWDQPGWLDDVTAWIGKQVALTGPVELDRRHTKPWSVVARVSTDRGELWFKEAGPALAFEPTLTQKLAQHLPRYLPNVVAAEGSRMLTRNAGRRLSKLRPKDLTTLTRAWEEVVAGYAELQIGARAVTELPAPDFRPETLAQLYGEPISQLVAELGDTIPPSLVHLAVTRNNVCIRNGSPVFLDWAQAVIGHPFCGLVKPLRAVVSRLGADPGGPEVQRIRDIYLEPWTTFAPLRELRPIVTAAYPLGILLRAISKDQLLDSVGLPRAPHGEARRRATFAQFLHAPDKLGG